ncbi:MAG: hypothetical protein EWV83_13415 [Microcystis sp. M_OC_Ca_00000000_S217Cul]|nr:MAG: hypothetical protein EWV83_13415 [Microcystis sp. M_OC_Ca_00000000_S217Cul]TRT86753.1 MAG: hypothetical protein EWV66_15615 [Microcystis sp. M_OC_Ca_00000000_C217Col]
MSDPPAYRHPPYQGGQGGSNLKSIFNLIITSYLISERIELKTFKSILLVPHRSPAPDRSLLG